MAGNPNDGGATPPTEAATDVDVFVQDKGPSKLPKQHAGAISGPSNSNLNIASSTDMGKVDLPGISKATGKPDVVARSTNRTRSRGRSKPPQAGEYNHTQLGQNPSRRSRSRVRNLVKNHPNEPLVAGMSGRDGVETISPNTVQTQQTQRSWAAVAKSAMKGYSLSYIPPTMVDGKPVVTISEEILEDTNPLWLECIVGYFVGKKLPFKLTEKAVQSLWGPQVTDVLANTDGFFFFHVPDEAFRRKILDGGPITIFRVPMILQQWHPSLKLEKNQHQALPVWVKLRNFPYALWSASGISAVASPIGKPLHVDMQTEKMRMISYARVCVELKASQPLLESVDVILNGIKWTIQVEYEWRPISCLSCGTFGHRCAEPAEASIGNHQASSQPVAAKNKVPVLVDEWETVKKKKGVPSVPPVLQPPKANNAPNSSQVKEATKAIPVPVPELSSLDSSDAPSESNANSEDSASSDECELEEDLSPPISKALMPEPLKSTTSQAPSKFASNVAACGTPDGVLIQEDLAKPMPGQAKKHNSSSNPTSSKKAKPKPNRGGSKRG